MSDLTDGATSPKTRKRPGGKAHTRPAAEKVKVSIVLTADMDFRLSVAAAALRVDRSTLVCQILAESPTIKRFVVHDRAKPAGEGPDDVSA